MIFDVYCDESRPDLLSSSKPGAQYMLIGSLWLPNACREEYKKEIHALGNKHKIGSEFKWQKVSPSKIDFYKELIDWFFEKQDQLRFRCIVVDHAKVDLQSYHLNDQELGFYKFYYQLLHHWIEDFNEYNIFIDFKMNRRRDRLFDLRSCLASANLSSKVNRVQAIESHKTVLLQLADVLTGISAYRMNNRINQEAAKHELLLKCEEWLGKKIERTTKSVHKFNVFEIDLSGGW